MSEQSASTGLSLFGGFKKAVVNFFSQPDLAESAFSQPFPLKDSSFAFQPDGLSRPIGHEYSFEVQASYQPRPIPASKTFEVEAGMFDI